MQLVTVLHAGQERWGVLEEDGSIRLAPAPPQAPESLLALIEADLAPLPEPDWELVTHGDATLLAPLPTPRRNILCLGLNYADHAEEAFRAEGKEVRLPEHPVVFTKATTTVTGPDSEIILEPEVTEQMDWEVELAVVIGRGGRHIPESDAMAHVFGYTIVNDLTARDIQFRHKQFFLGKSLDGSCPMGPGITTAQSIADPHSLDIRCRVNGELKQQSNTARMIFRIPHVIHVLSRIVRLQPGDVIATGTPAGVGFARNPPEYLRPGDEIECEITGLGVLRNRCV